MNAIEESFPVLNIDAWGNQEDGFEWNDVRRSGTVELAPDATHADILQAMVDAGFLNDKALTECVIDDDQYNYVVTVKETREPLFAIEYGSKY